MCAKRWSDCDTAIAALVVTEYVLRPESGSVITILGRGTLAEQLYEVWTPSSRNDAGIHRYSFSTYAEDVHV